MSHKDYCVLADTIILSLRASQSFESPEILKGIWFLVYKLMSTFEATYPRFDRKRFIDYIEQGLNNE